VEGVHWAALCKLCSMTCESQCSTFFAQLSALTNSPHVDSPARTTRAHIATTTCYRFPWHENRTNFLANFDHFVSGCASAGIRPLVVLFDDDFIDAPGVTSVAQIDPWLATGAYKTSEWLANPGMPLVRRTSGLSRLRLCKTFLGVRAQMTAAFLGMIL
jgi:hypothetical protein